MTDDAYYAHCYLREIRNLNIRLEIKRLEQEDVFNKAQGCGGMSAGFKVQTSPRGDAMEMAVVKLTELRKEYEELFVRYMAVRDVVIELIKTLPQGDEQNIIKLYYVYGEKDPDIAKVVHLTRSRVTQIRHKALDTLGRHMRTEIIDRISSKIEKINTINFDDAI